MKPSTPMNREPAPNIPRRTTNEPWPLIAALWQIKTTLAHGHGRAALLRRLLADQQVSPTGLACVPMLNETVMNGRWTLNVKCSMFPTL
jgi:hypothetical protein